MRAAIYSRFSSDLQREESLADQTRACLDLIERRGWTLVATYGDAAISGAKRDRPELQRLLADAKAGRFDVLVLRSLDRLSRDLEDSAGFHKRLKFARVKIVTLNDGEIGDLHVGIRGTISAAYLSDLAENTRQGLLGKVESGRSAGGRSFGYRAVCQRRMNTPQKGRLKFPQADATARPRGV
ncbi:hypothetical protein TSO221_32925, partial [Azospirillum sp. TSO22-1]